MALLKSVYLANLRATLRPARWSKRATVLTFVITYTWVYSLVAKDLLATYYAGLVTMGVLVAIVHPATREFVIPGASLPDLPRQLLWVPVILGLFTTGYVAVGFPLRAQSFEENLHTFTLQVLIVAPVESFLQAWLWPQVLPYGPVTAQVLFAALHADKIAAHPEFFFVALLAGFVFLLFTVLRDYLGASALPRVRRWSRYFGFVATVAVHGTINTIALVFLLYAGSFEIVPFQWSALPALALLAAVAAATVLGRGKVYRK